MLNPVQTRSDFYCCIGCNIRNTICAVGTLFRNLVLRVFDLLSASRRIVMHVGKRRGHMHGVSHFYFPLNLPDRKNRNKQGTAISFCAPGQNMRITGISAIEGLLQLSGYSWADTQSNTGRSFLTAEY